MGTRAVRWAVIAVVALVVGWAVPTAVASGGVVWGRGHELTTPPNAKADPRSFPESVSCTSAGNCTVVGSYYTTGGVGMPMVDTETNGHWAAAQELSLPANASAKGPFASLFSVSCSISPRDCTAVGAYTDTQGDYLAMTATELGGAWGPAQQLTLPGNAVPFNEKFSPQQYASLDSVSCTSRGNCTAVGEYVTKADFYEPMAATEVGDSWGPGGELSLPTNASTSPNQEDIGLDSVSCTSVGHCTAVGTYSDDTGAEHPMVAAEDSSGDWGRAEEFSLPGNWSTMGFDALDSVSCASAGDCTAVGYYEDRQNFGHAMTAVENKGAWTQPKEMTLPGESGLESVSCSSAAKCVAVGSYDCTVNGGCTYTPPGPGIGPAGTAITVTQTNGAWAKAKRITLPTHAAVSYDAYAGLFAVSCTGPNNCTAAGSYLGKRDNQEGMVISASPATPSKLRVIHADFHNQRITLRTPAACVVQGAKFVVRLSSTNVAGSKAAALTFSHASFYLDRGVAHHHRRTTTYSANATVRHVPVTIKLALDGLKKGAQLLKVIIVYKHDRKTLTKALRTSFSIC